MNKPVETIPCEHGVVIKVYQDTDAQNPNDYNDDSCCFLWSDDRDLYLVRRKDGEATGRVMGVSKDDLLYDEGADPSAPTKYAVFPVGIGYRGDCLNRLGDDISGDNDAIEDSNSFILVRRADFPPGHDLRAAAMACFEEWNTYLSGDVYGFVVEDSEGEELHSCWGFYGLDYCIEEARSAAEAEMPIARGRALLKKAADDVQRVVVKAADVHMMIARDRTGTVRAVSKLTPSEEADIKAAINGDKDTVRYAELSWMSNIVPAAVHSAWRKRYWPGD